MASDAGGLHGTMFHFLHAKGCCAAVAQGALITWHSCRRDGGNVVGRLGHHITIRAAMAGLACSRHHSGMVECRGQPAGKAMVTRLAPCRSGQVAGRFDVDVGICTAMAVAATGAGYTCMRVGRNERQPGKPGSMTGIAGLCRRDMRGRLAACVHIIVASGAASSHHSNVGKAGWLPCRSGMACIAGLRRRNVRCVFGLRIYSNITAIMAACTIACCNRACCVAVAHGCR